MKRIILTTADGSKTISVPELAESYHSTHGALQEARHVFIKNGLCLVEKNDINILELGFGTGLDALVTAEAVINFGSGRQINYFGVEKYPLNPEELKALQYSENFDDEHIASVEQKIHDAPWEVEQPIFGNFILKKIRADFYEIKNMELPPVDLVYFDCFGAAAQPDLWERPLAEIISEKMATGGILTTYSSKGSFRRILQELGFEVSKKPGPPGKREMVVAVKK